MSFGALSAALTVAPRSRSLLAYARDTEARYFMLVIFASVAGIAILLYGSGTYAVGLKRVAPGGSGVVSAGG